MHRLALSVAGVLAGCTSLLGIGEPGGGTSEDAGAPDAGAAFTVAFDPP
jgi:hypothetical protein